jgi:N-acetylglucosamine-6-sulfatase
VEPLQALDDLVEGVVNRLQRTGALRNTYVVFTSDNGWHHGEHRIPKAKAQPYEESIQIPLLVRGPGVQLGSTTNKLTLNTDFLPTFMDLAGVTTPEYVDGRTLRPLLEGSTTTTWQTAVLLERRKVVDSNT